MTKRGGEIHLRYDGAMRGYDIFIGDKDLWRAQMDYYKLPKDDRWLEEDNPYSIGGRDTDISAIAWSLRNRVRGLYPINKVPDEFVVQLGKLAITCQCAEDMIRETIELITDYRVSK